MQVEHIGNSILICADNMQVDIFDHVNDLDDLAVVSDPPYGVEIEQEYFDYACERIAKAQCVKMPDYLNENKDQSDMFA